MSALFLTRLLLFGKVLLDTFGVFRFVERRDVVYFVFLLWFPNTCGSFGGIIVIIQENKAGHRFTGKMPCERQRCFNWHCGKRDQRKFCQPRIATIAAIEIEHVGDTLKVKKHTRKVKSLKEFFTLYFTNHKSTMIKEQFYQIVRLEVHERLTQTPFQ